MISLTKDNKSSKLNKKPPEIQRTVLTRLVLARGQWYLGVSEMGESIDPCLFDNSHSNKYERVFPCGFDLHFLDI